MNSKHSRGGRRPSARDVVGDRETADAPDYYDPRSDYGADTWYQSEPDFAAEPFDEAPAQWNTEPGEGRWDSWASGEPAEDPYQPYEYAASEPPQPDPADIDSAPSRRTGAHRTPAPPTAMKGRAAVVAVAAGAVVAAGQAEMEATGQHRAITAADYETAGHVREIAAPGTETGSNNVQNPQLLNVAPVADVSQFQDILQHGERFAADVNAATNSKLRPLFTKFTNGTFTSGFGTRWGAEHLGVDVAAPIGTPIYAVEDGTVIDAGPASGFGMWVRLRHEDGTITVYGHVNTTTVSVGDHVLAGDQIATVGNRGYSTGPHCHFEVWLHGKDKVDPLPWLASRGISLGQERD